MTGSPADDPLGVNSTGASAGVLLRRTSTEGSWEAVVLVGNIAGAPALSAGAGLLPCGIASLSAAPPPRIARRRSARLGVPV